jgi:hypothetical protein
MSKNLATASLQKATEFVHIFYHFLLLQEEEKEELVVRCQLHFTRNLKPLSETSAKLQTLRSLRGGADYVIFLTLLYGIIFR